MRTTQRQDASPTRSYSVVTYARSAAPAASLYDSQEARPASPSATERTTYEVPIMLPGDFGNNDTFVAEREAGLVGADDRAVAHHSGEGRYLERIPLPVSPAMPGIVLPYPVTNVFGTFSDCRPGGRTHAGLDLGGIGELGGLGTPLYAMARSRVVFIGRPEEDAERFGTPDTRGGTVQRGPRDMDLPRRADVPGYGRVHYFTRDYGSWHSGAIIVMQALEGPLEGHKIRYMHVGAIHPELRVGDIVEAGQEVALMGGTAVQQDMPHVHIDIEDERGRRVDVAPFVGLPADPGRCRR